jgi:hypothetical protein
VPRRAASAPGVASRRTTHAHGVERTLTPAERAVVKQKCADAGLGQTSLGSVCEFQSPDPDVVKQNIADCREWVKLAQCVPSSAVRTLTDLASAYPYGELFSLMGRTGFSGFTLCEYPQPVAVSEGASWLRAYRARWNELRQPQA